MFNMSNHLGAPRAFAIALLGCHGAWAAPILYPGNGHYYELIDATVDWSEADAAAKARVYSDARGHLVTITSADENLFLTSAFGPDALHLHWTGGFQPAGSPEPDGGWTWVTGEAFTFSNWFPPAEPNNSGGGEDRLIFDHDVQPNGKSWNDLASSDLVRGYVVEFDVPEPGSLTLVALGALVLAGIRRAHRRGF